MKYPLKLIGITGHKGSGKDTVGRILNEIDGFEIVRWAGGLKAMVDALLRYQGCPDITINRIIEGDLKQVPLPYFGGRTARHVMQSLGTEWGRTLIYPALWTDSTEARIKAHPHVVVTDLRYLNEAAVIRRLGGKIWRIEREGCHGDEHPSETEMRQIEVDVTISNNDSVDHLCDKVRAIYPVAFH
jgi:hypothetical protein